MARSTETIDPGEQKRLEKLRLEGEKNLDQWLERQIKQRPTLDQIALLSNTGRLQLYYEAIGKARLEGHSWLRISAAARGGETYKDGMEMHSRYRSFCRNNGIDPVKLRKDPGG